MRRGGWGGNLEEPQAGVGGLRTLEEGTGSGLAQESQRTDKKC
jgi:hypothetical protein